MLSNLLKMPIVQILIFKIYREWLTLRNFKQYITAIKNFPIPPNARITKVCRPRQLLQEIYSLFIANLETREILLLIRRF